MDSPVALIVTHGQPSAPDEAEASLATVASAIAAVMPGWRIGSATLAAEGRLAAAIADLGPRGLVFPMFMACGWFTGTHLPGRLRAAGGAGWHLTLPMGCNPAIQTLAIAQVQEALVQPASATDLILAAHGSGRSTAPSLIAGHVARSIQRSLGLRRAVAAFIDEAPRLADAQGFGKDALCLPYFAAEGGHVTGDIPHALQSAGFAGRILPPLGLDPRVPLLIAQTLRMQQFALFSAG
ncbi:MAG: cobalamin biosynthesis protein CbiX [Rhodobacteraceae bacterium]|jgi:sirohydrochlorin ferrochelatase|nr:cobalamin biosynthesis protein CbiX [Paracoccaceae bacterium]